ncbi:hypothetical protein D9619_009814 [Psilocybe cf. subviscida]|uniref:DUF6535 domain-containing protein n=1 Tax=Psilocybe cf. subviscida TaxID=2480587 RepID=A0A8H5BKX2_9AGAR|nr:hypothetical protein D9619_009814 [Psilocybe cf. subviscida]
MSSESGLASVENASAGECEATRAQGGEMSFGPSAQSSVNPRNSDVDIIQEQRVDERDSMHSLAEENPGSNGSASPDSPDDISMPELPKPKANSKPDFDPFERLLKPMREQDDIQCNAWKDEVQNLLIFAGLFSAVVTAFIIESYQRLQPDPNDAIVGLLAHIAERLDNPSVNGTVSVSSIVSNTNFSPSRPDININIFWFISLVLSLTVALIGIIALQWLREHQRYDSSLKPSETMAILYMRLESLSEWYVPQIFAGLPLLLQGALVLFLAGMVEFLLALRLEVAIPVTLTICIPLVFLIATTILPLLQVYALQDPFRLSVSNKVPSPCPYKSPQSLILRLIGVHSTTVVKSIAAVFAGAYACVVQITILVQKLAGRSSSVLHSQQQDLHVLLQNHGFRDICDVQNSAQWTSIDVSWMGSRTEYVTLSQVVNSENIDSVTELRLFRSKSKTIMSPEAYDCTCCLRMLLVEARAKADHHTIYHCIVFLLSRAVDNFHYNNRHAPRKLVRLAEVDFATVLGQILCHVYVETQYHLNPIDTAAFVKDAIFHTFLDGSQTTVEALCAAFMVSLWRSVFSSPLEPNPEMQNTIEDAAFAFTIGRLSISPRKLFAMSSDNTWYPWFLQISSYVPENHLLSGPHLSRTFFERCSKMRLKSLALRPGPVRKNYGGLQAYMYYTVHYQVQEDVDGIVVHLRELCCSSSNTPTSALIREKPFLMIAVCIYLYANVICLSLDHLPPKFQPLANIMVDACGLGPDVTFKDSDDMDKAINAIYRHHDPSTQSTNTLGNSPPPRRL